jgi:hypothetical protein
MRTRKRDHSSTVPQELSRAAPAFPCGVPSTPRITLPNDLSNSLRHLGDAELQQLLAAVTREISRRNQGTSISGSSKADGTATFQSAQSRKKASNVDEIPEGKANLIRASFGAGLKRAAIARMFRISPSLVNRIIASTEKSKR